MAPSNNPRAAAKEAFRRSARDVYRQSRGAARWVAALEVLLGAVERAVWDLRRAYDDMDLLARDSWSDMKSAALTFDGERKATQQEIKRLMDVSATVTKIVLSYRGLAIQSAFLSRASAERKLEALHGKNGERFYRMAERLQGGFIKIGQMVSARTDVLSPAFTAALAPLQDACAPAAWETIEGVLKVQWGERFAGVTLEPQPIGAGSIAQVHKAVLPDGRTVAVKVLRPGIREILGYDMANLRRVIEALTAYLPGMDVEPVLAEIETQVLREVDFEAERASIRRMHGLLADWKWVATPALVDEWCAEGVLVTEFVAGVRLDKALEARPQERREDLLYRLADLYATKILTWGFFQPDTHPGNFLVTEDDRIVLLDFGCARELAPAFRQSMLRVIEGFMRNDDALLGAGLDAMGFRTRSGNPAAMGKLAREMLAAVIASGGWDPDQLEAAAVRSLETVLEDPIHTVPQDFIMVGRAILTLGGLFYTYRPSFDLTEIFLPLLGDALSTEVPN
jgi:predicted unusual protein kinase regulating ubiquinone biosynthesis (AarF/ABC1/UbiB family)